MQAIKSDKGKWQNVVLVVPVAPFCACLRFVRWAMKMEMKIYACQPTTEHKCAAFLWLKHLRRQLPAVEATAAAATSWSFVLASQVACPGDHSFSFSEPNETSCYLWPRCALMQRHCLTSAPNWASTNKISLCGLRDVRATCYGHVLESLLWLQNKWKS